LVSARRTNKVLADALMKVGWLSLFVAFAGISLPVALVAHHSVSVEFDESRRLPLTGTVTKVEWQNPHTFFYIDVRDPKTKMVNNWACQLGSPNMLANLGWTRTTLKVGMTVSLTGTVARDGSRKVIARKIIADKSPLAAWPSEAAKR
jgi:hypothetical protein